MKKTIQKRERRTHIPKKQRKAAAEAATRKTKKRKKEKESVGEGRKEGRRTKSNGTDHHHITYIERESKINTHRLHIYILYYKKEKKKEKEEKERNK